MFSPPSQFSRCFINQRFKCKVGFCHSPLVGFSYHSCFHLVDKDENCRCRRQNKFSDIKRERTRLRRQQKKQRRKINFWRRRTINFSMIPFLSFFPLYLQHCQVFNNSRLFLSFRGLALNRCVINRTYTYVWFYILPL